MSASAIQVIDDAPAERTHGMALRRSTLASRPVAYITIDDDDVPPCSVRIAECCVCYGAGVRAPVPPRCAHAPAVCGRCYTELVFARGHSACPLCRADLRAAAVDAAICVD